MAHPAIIFGGWLLDVGVEALNLSHFPPDLPEECHGYYGAEEYASSQNYLRETTRLGIIEGTFFTSLLLAFYFRGGFGLVDTWARSFAWETVGTGVIFAAALFAGVTILAPPFAIYSTFVIEERYGFNRTTPKTFVLDRVKGLLLTVLLGMPVFALVIWFFKHAGPLAWLYCWIGLTGLKILLTFIAPVIFLPLFNKFEPLAEGPLRDKIERYAESQNFKLGGIFTMDASKRSSKANAFFTGFGRFRRIVLFDTLFKKFTEEELVAILAHETGHFRKGHILWMTGLSIAASGMMFFLLSFFITSPELAAAFGVKQPSVYAGLVFFGFLFMPIELILSVASNILSRRFEYEADDFAARTHGNPGALAIALKKLSVDNLSNLTPHPLKVFLDYSHPPALARIRRLERPAIG